MSVPVLELNKVKAYRGRKTVLDVPRFLVQRGELLSLIGPNGAGKSTLLQVINALLPHAEGEIRLFGTSIAGFDRVELRRRCAMVFQEPLFVRDTVYENVAMPLRLRGWKGEDVKRRVQAALELFRCHHLAERLALRLSGGEAQRVCLARAFVTEPELLLLDEPFTALDPATRSDLLAELRQAAIAREMTVLLVSHNLSDVLNFTERAVVMEEGKIAQDADPETVMRRPVSVSVARLVGMDNIIACRVEERQGAAVIRMPGGLDIPWTGDKGAAGSYCCLPGDAFSLAPEGQAEGQKTDFFYVKIEVLVRQIIPGVGIYKAVVSCNGLELNIALPKEQGRKLAVGQKAWVLINPKEAHLV